ncbi:MAG: hypothetical protein V4463_22185, partial [Pseudomonadota bacterium]
WAGSKEARLAQKKRPSGLVLVMSFQYSRNDRANDKNNDKQLKNACKLRVHIDERHEMQYQFVLENGDQAYEYD